jgi:hypothetical protein
MVWQAALVIISGGDRDYETGGFRADKRQRKQELLFSPFNTFTKLPLALWERAWPP